MITKTTYQDPGRERVSVQRERAGNLKEKIVWSNHKRDKRTKNNQTKRITRNNHRKNHTKRIVVSNCKWGVAGSCRNF